MIFQLKHDSYVNKFRQELWLMYDLDKSTSCGNKQCYLCNMGYPSETHLDLNSREVSFAHNLLLSHKIVLKSCTEHGSITAVLCTKFQNDWTNDTDVIDERDIARIKFTKVTGTCDAEMDHYIWLVNSHYIQFYLRVKCHVCVNETFVKSWFEYQISTLLLHHEKAHSFARFLRLESRNGQLPHSQTQVRNQTSSGPQLDSSTQLLPQALV